MKIITEIACTDYFRPGHPERPQRVSETLKLLERQQGLPLSFESPGECNMEAVALVHPVSHLTALDSEVDFDGDTPAHPGIKDHALRSVAGALLALDSALGGEAALSLLRPPGHHALADRAMGFCYLNQMAVAAAWAAREGRRVAVLDFDVHHGNGTEALLLGRSGQFYASAHQSPAYPGTGMVSRDNVCNYPVRPNASRVEFADAVKRALDDVLDFGPDVIGVSAGFDAFRGDPLAQENLEGEDYFDFGRRLKDIGIPTFAVLEGGYANELPDLVLEFLSGLA